MIFECFLITLAIFLCGFAVGYKVKQADNNQVQIGGSKAVQNQTMIKIKESE